MVPARQCPQCGREFAPRRRSDAITCSVACRKERSRARKTASLPATPEKRPALSVRKQLGIVVLVADSRSQQAESGAARDLFRGALFTASSRWATRLGVPWAILSTRYGLVFPDTLVRPYDLSAPDERRDLRWARSVNDQLRETFPAGTIFVVLGARRYCEALELGTPLPHSAPLRGKSVETQLELLRRALTGDEPLLTQPLMEFVYFKVGNGDLRVGANGVSAASSA